MSSGFGDAPIKIEGQPLWVDEKLQAYANYEQPFETTYVEVSMPVALEEMAHAVLKAMRTQWLIDNGFPEEGDLL
jgi:hypothetical protein